MMKRGGECDVSGESHIRWFCLRFVTCITVAFFFFFLLSHSLHGQVNTWKRIEEANAPCVREEVKAVEEGKWVWPFVFITRNDYAIVAMVSLFFPASSLLFISSSLCTKSIARKTQAKHPGFISTSHSKVAIKQLRVSSLRPFARHLLLSLSLFLSHSLIANGCDLTEQQGTLEAHHWSNEMECANREKKIRRARFFTSLASLCAFCAIHLCRRRRFANFNNSLRCWAVESSTMCMNIVCPVSEFTCIRIRGRSKHLQALSSLGANYINWRVCKEDTNWESREKKNCCRW